MGNIIRDPRLMELSIQFIEIYEPISSDDAYDSLKELLGGSIESMLEAELKDSPGYLKEFWWITLPTPETDSAK